MREGTGIMVHQPGVAVMWGSACGTEGQRVAWRVVTPGHSSCLAGRSGLWRLRGGCYRLEQCWGSPGALTGCLWGATAWRLSLVSAGKKFTGGLQ